MRGTAHDAIPAATTAAAMNASGRRVAAPCSAPSPRSIASARRSLACASRAGSAERSRRGGSSASAAGSAVSVSRVMQPVPSAENAPISRTAGTSLTHTAAKPIQVVRPETATGSRIARSVRSATAPASPAARSSS